MLVSLLEELVRRPSLTPNDAGCQDFCAEQLAQHGFVNEALHCEDVSNAWIRRGNDLPLFVFAGHTDVVPVGEERAWTHPPFVPTIKDGVMLGRGCADMKGGLAAMLHACLTFVQKHPKHRGSIAFLLTSDEEGRAIHGTRHAIEKLKQQGVHIDWCVLGEPSSDTRVGDTIRYGRRGSLTGKLQVIGRQGHVAFPQKIKNPIHLACAVLDELSHITWDQGDEHFPPTSFQWYRVYSDAQASNIVPQTLSAEFNLRFSPQSTAQSIRERIEAVCKKQAIEYQLEWHLSAQPFLTQPGKLVACAQQAIEDIAGYPAQLSTGGGTSDGRFIVDACSELIELGPVNASIHQVDEWVNLDELHTLSNIYQALLERLLLTA